MIAQRFIDFLNQIESCQILQILVQKVFCFKIINISSNFIRAKNSLFENFLQKNFDCDLDALSFAINLLLFFISINHVNENVISVLVKIVIDINIQILRDYLLDYLQCNAMLNFLIIYLICSNQSDFLNKKLFNVKNSIENLKNVIDECEILYDCYESTNELKIKKKVRCSLRRQKRHYIIIFIVEKIDQLVLFVKFLTDRDDHVFHFDQIHEKFVYEQNEKSIDKDDDFLFQFKTNVSKQSR